MARTISFFDGFSSSTTPVIGNIAASDLVTYPDDATYEATEQGAPADGNIYYNTTLDRVRYYANAAWHTFADIDQVQTFINKSIDGANNTITNVDGDEVIVDAISGLTATDAQAAFAEHQTEIEQNTSDIGLNTADIVDIRSTTGTSDGDTNMGTYTGTVLTDSTTTKANIQELGTQVDTNTSDISTLQNLPYLQLKGSWNASTNTPTLANTDTGVLGFSYKVSVAGTHDFGAGNITFVVGDLVFNDGSVWDKDTEQVTSVAGKTGTVTLVASDITDFDTEVSNNTSVTANTAKVSADGSIDTHSDVDTTTTAPVLNDVLKWDGSNFVPDTTSGGSGDYTYVSTTTTPYGASIDEYIDMDATAGNKTIDLPAASGNAGKRIFVRKADSSSNIVTIDGDSAETINGSLTYVLSNQYNAILLVCDGSNWMISSKNLNELIEASATLQSYSFSSAAFGDLTSISLPIGKFDIIGSVVYKSNTSTGIGLLGISTTSGNSATGLVEGVNSVNITIPASTNASLYVSDMGVVVTAPTTYYLKGFWSVVSGSPVVSYKISARRVD